jgi:hypothetical protein
VLDIETRPEKGFRRSSFNKRINQLTATGTREIIQIIRTVVQAPTRLSVATSSHKTFLDVIQCFSPWLLQRPRRVRVAPTKNDNTLEYVRIFRSVNCLGGGTGVQNHYSRHNFAIDKVGVSFENKSVFNHACKQCIKAHGIYLVYRGVG